MIYLIRPVPFGEYMSKKNAVYYFLPGYWRPYEGDAKFWEHRMKAREN